MAGLPAYFLGKQEVNNIMLLPVINKEPFSLFDADFNQISSDLDNPLPSGLIIDKVGTLCYFALILN